LLRAVVLSAAVAALTAVVVYAGAYLLFPVTGLEVTGARMFPESEAWQALPNRASLLTLNTGALERKIESNPWVQGVEVLKNWESGIVTVKVKERRPVLSGLLNGREVFYSADGAELPGLGTARLGRVELDAGRLEEILGIVGTLRESRAGLESVDGAGARGVTVIVDGRRVLLSGDVGLDQARALEGIMEEHPEAPYFDLRSPGRVVVGEPEGQR
jgi:cell division protein FtsQ